MSDRKLAMAVLGKLKPASEPESAPVDELAWAAEDLVKALKDGSTMRVKGALCSFMDLYMDKRDDK